MTPFAACEQRAVDVHDTKGNHHENEPADHLDRLRPGAGVIVGYACNTLAASPAQAKEIASYFSILTDIFLRLIKMIIARWCSPPWWLAWRAWVTPVRWAASAAGRWAGSSAPRFAALFIGLIFANVLHPATR